MANRRMFSKIVIDTDAFLDMPLSTQALYFHLALRADDDGFVANPKKILRMLGVNDDDYKVLLTKRFVLPFESGICVIKHWLVHNFIRKDRYTKTQWVDEKNSLYVDPRTNKYTTEQPNVIPDGNQTATQVRLELGKDSIDNSKGKKIYGDIENVFLTEKELEKLKSRYGFGAINKLIDEFSTYLPNKPGKPYKDHFAALLNWAKRKGIVENKVTPAKAIKEKPLTPEEIEKNEELKSEIRRSLKTKKF